MLFRSLKVDTVISLSFIKSFTRNTDYSEYENVAKLTAIVGLHV
jgi:hypothetical protein